MSTPVLLTAPPAPSFKDADPLNGERTSLRNGAARGPPFGFVFSSSSACAPSADTTTDDAYSDPDARRVALVEERVRQWTGAPIRAVVPLPRRKRVLPNDDDDVVRAAAAVGRSTAAPSCLLSRDMDSGAEIEAEDRGVDEEEEEEEEEEDEGDASSGLRHCSYESITAAEGLAAWSFEELRAECYAQSLIARGTKPPAVVQPALAIPPAFVPRIVPRS